MYRNEKIKTNRATHNDIDTLCDLRKYLLSAGKTHYSSNSIEDEINWIRAYKEWLKYNIDNDSINIICNFIDDNLVGCLIGIIDQRAPLVGMLNGRSGWIQTVVVHPDYRGNGITKINLNLIENWFLEKSVYKIYLQPSERSENLYFRNGFFDTSEKLLYKRTNLS